MTLLATFLGVICFVASVYTLYKSIECKDYSMVLLMIIGIFVVGYADIVLIAELVSE